jgi:hypothetical protein
MTSDEEALIRRRFAEAQVAGDPFPHLIIRDVLPLTIYRAMEAAAPSTTEFQRAARRHRREQPFNLPRLKSLIKFWRPVLPADASFHVSHEKVPTQGLERYSPIWRDRFGTCIDLINTLAHEKLKAPGYIEGQRVFFFRPSGWAINPHHHVPQELLNLLLYFPSAENTPDQGTLLYRQRESSQTELVRPIEHSKRSVEPAVIVPYLPNMMVAWLNSKQTVHGSIEIAGAAARRYLYINSTRV